MNSIRCFEDLGAYLDGELSRDENKRVSAHIAECTPCRQRLEEMKNLSMAIGSLPRHRLPATIRTAVLEADPASIPRHTARSFLGRPLVAASLASAAVVIVVTMIWMPGPQLISSRVPIQKGFSERSAGKAKMAAASDPEAKSTTDEITAAPKGPGQASMRRMESFEKHEEAETTSGTLAVGEFADNAPPVMDMPSTPRFTNLPVASLNARTEPEASAIKPPAPVSRYTARLITTPTGEISLTRLMPATEARADGFSPQDSIGSKRGSEEDRSGREAVVAPSRPSTRSRSDQTDDFRSGGQRIPQTHLFFLADVDADGTILAADPIGARLTSVDILQTARALVVGTVLTPYPIATSSQVIVDVLVASTPAPTPH